MTFRPTTRCGQPAHLAFTGRVTASLIAEHGSYAAARAWLARNTDHVSTKKEIRNGQ